MLINRELLENSELSECVLCRGKILLDYETGERACGSCGLVVGHERSVNGDASFERASIRRPNHDYSSVSGFAQTHIDRRNVDSTGRRIFSKEDLDSIRKLDRFTLNSDNEHRNLTKATTEIIRISEQLGIGTAATQEACSLYVKAFRQGLIRGRTVYGIGSAAIYLACRLMGIPRMIEEIADCSQSEDRSEVAAYCKLLIRKLGIDLSKPSARAHVAQIARNAKLSTLTQRKALSILSEIEDNASLSGRRPISVAAGALYLACKATGENKSQLRIAGAADLTPTTIRKSSLEIQRIQRESHSESSETKDQLMASDDVAEEGIQTS